MEASLTVQWRNMFHVCVGADSYVSCYLMKDLASDPLRFAHFPSRSSVQARSDLFFQISLFIFRVNDPFSPLQKKTSIQFSFVDSSCGSRMKLGLSSVCRRRFW